MIQKTLSSSSSTSPSPKSSSSLTSQTSFFSSLGSLPSSISSLPLPSLSSSFSVLPNNLLPYVSLSLLSSPASASQTHGSELGTVNSAPHEGEIWSSDTKESATEKGTDLTCFSFNSTACLNGPCPTSTVKCLDNNGGKRLCYSLWTNLTEEISNDPDKIAFKHAGCLTGPDYDCANSSKCIATRFTKGHFFCCCQEDHCNSKVHFSDLSSFNPYVTSPAPRLQANEVSEPASTRIWPYLLISLLITIVLALLALYYTWSKRRRKDLIRSKRFGEDEESVSITNQMNGLSCFTNCNNGPISLTGTVTTNGGIHHLTNGNNKIDSGNRNIQLLEKLSTGRFGSVWKAKLFYSSSNLDFDGGGDNSLITSSSLNYCDTKEDEEDEFDTKSNDYKIVAVKIFPPHERSSWIIEQLVFKTPQIEHENILRFLGSEKRDESNNVPLSSSVSGFWLITEYHEFGSLCDYLKKRMVTLDELIKIGAGIAAGLDHLHSGSPKGFSGKGDESNHSENGNKGNYKMKPSIVHRDFKSRNVLLKPDLTPRIADFGLALIFYPNRTPAGLGQVGTRRYMAPEVLEGAINYTQDSLYRIDIYACGLVLWELISRCYDPIEEDDKGDDKIEGLPRLKVSDHKLPFEDEVGLNPSLEDMQETVCQAKKRPLIQKQWLDHPFLRVICETIEECWDQDAEARLSASCILERLTILARNRVNTRT